MGSKTFINRSKELEFFRSRWREWSLPGRKSAEIWSLFGPRGVGRSSLLDRWIAQTKGEARLVQVSFLEGPLILQILPQIGLHSSQEVSSVPAALSLWQERLLIRPSEGLTLLVFRDVQEIEEVEQVAFQKFLRSLERAGEPILVILEFCSKPGIPFFLNKLGFQQKWELEPLEASDGENLVQSIVPDKKIKKKVLSALNELAKGFPERMYWYASSYLLKSLKNKWPLSEAELLDRLAKELNPNEIGLLQCLGIHSSWITVEFLEALAGTSGKEIEEMLSNFEKFEWVVDSQWLPGKWLLKWSELGSYFLKFLSQEEKRELHRKSFYFLLGKKDWLFRSTWLAYHAGQAEMKTEAYSWYIQASQVFSAQGGWETASSLAYRALNFCDSDFKRAYGHMMIGDALLAQGKYESSLRYFRKAMSLAESIPWADFVQVCSLKAGELSSFMGNYSDAQVLFQKALPFLKDPAKRDERISTKQQLGMCFLEQAKYPEALQVYGDLEKETQKKSDPMAGINSKIAVLQVQIALGKGREALKLLEEIDSSVRDDSFSFLVPLLDLLRGKLYLTQGNLALAMGLLEEAGKGFEAQKDINGKVEVLLAMSAPLLELNFIQEAHDLIDHLAQWDNLKLIPSLRHSIQLRRLAIGAFLGKMVEEDLRLLRRESQRVGRAEDWFQFWFHLALAGQSRKDKSFFNEFIARAKQLAQGVADRLDPGDRETFLQRYDIKRIYRLSEEPGGPQKVQIKGRRSEGAGGPADAATLAPPTKGNSGS